MATYNYLDKTGLGQLWSKIKSYVSGLIPYPDWEENDSTSANYIENRTHYRESTGYFYKWDVTEAINNVYQSSSINIIEDIRYYYEGYDDIPSDNNMSYSDINLSAESIDFEYVINGIKTRATLLPYEYKYQTIYKNNDIAINYYYDNSDVRIVLGLKTVNLGSSDQQVDSAILYLPTTREKFIYHKLNHNYIDGKFITEGSGKNSEIFNDTDNNSAYGSYSHAEGRYTSGDGDNSHAEGHVTWAGADSSHAEGGYTIASMEQTHAEGFVTIAAGSYSHAEGAGFDYGFEVGFSISGDAGSWDYTVNDYDYDIEEYVGYLLVFSLYDSDSGITIKQVIREIQHADNTTKTISLNMPLDEDNPVTNQWVTLVRPTRSGGYASHAEGVGTFASGRSSHAEGEGTIAASYYQHAQGKYNIADENNTYAHIVGNGYDDESRSNIHTLDWSGNGWYAGKLTVGTNPTADMDVVTKKYVDDSGFMTGMTILSYGTSTWADFIDAYTNKKVVYCRASSASNPATGSQTRLAFMAFVNDAENPTNVEFQYYRSVNAHSMNQQGDQVYVYKLDKNSGWSVTVRECYTKVVAGTGLTGNWASGAITLGLSSSIPVGSTATPQPLGTASAGSSSDFSKADHVHALPTLSISSNVITLTGASGQTTSITLPVYNGGVSSS